ncbi:hypothetical protein C6988_06585 [Nitrosopumilus sp. b1]|uniref:hypothetical protein n=1 Tax=Nitrosopumilus sp. b1 TaxID=2109907 RepID=UPI0015F66581|nr:hypothetical protein [Nitrosopumilus sp. b1]KAF6242839.1 hypothetical protein C6988_06585 [Nitrosopumilus sp. b1]
MDKKYIASLTGILILIAIFFSITFYIYPNQIYQQNNLVPIPILDVTLSSNEIQKGESFVLDIVSKNTGDIADIQIVSIAFPGLEDTLDNVKIKNYDFTQSPHYVKIGDEIGAKYSGGKETILAKYPSIEAYSRPVPSGTINLISVEITPQESGIFDIYVKSIGIPHFTDESHYPQAGILDHQSELVEVYSVTVNP